MLRPVLQYSCPKVPAAVFCRIDFQRSLDFGLDNLKGAELITALDENIGEAVAKASVSGYQWAVSSVDDLLQVKGIGVRTVELNRSNILLGK